MFKKLLLVSHQLVSNAEPSWVSSTSNLNLTLLFLYFLSLHTSLTDGSGFVPRICMLNPTLIHEDNQIILSWVFGYAIDYCQQISTLSYKTNPIIAIIQPTIEIFGYWPRSFEPVPKSRGITKLLWWILETRVHLLHCSLYFTDCIMERVFSAPRDGPKHYHSWTFSLPCFVAWICHGRCSKATIEIAYLSFPFNHKDERSWISVQIVLGNV